MARRQGNLGAALHLLAVPLPLPPHEVTKAIASLIFQGFFWPAVSASLIQCPIVVHQRTTQLFGSVWKVTL